MTNTFQNILAWQKAHELVLLIYEITKSFPKNEIFGLISQFQRAAVSIPANIAEGYKRLSSTEKLRFYNIAQGSLEECRYYMILSYDLKYITKENYDIMANKLEETSKMLNSYCYSISKSDYSKQL